MAVPGSLSLLMPPCGTCIEDINTPVSLPCGHLFCSECIERAVNAISPYSTLHSCPVCRASYTVAAVDTALVPAYLRPHILPSVRRLYTEFPCEAPRTIPAATEIAMENSRLHAENEALRTTCGMWRRRAEVHGAAIIGLTGFARTVRDEAIKMRRERDEVFKYYNTLLEKLPASESFLHPLLPRLSTYAELPSVPPAFTEAPPLPLEESVLPSSLSRRSLRSTSPKVEEKELPRPAKRERLTDSA